mmetsp:Transcript_109317/g.314856  ORF Transcript_109317/g.314856 Transcript_109317/m.314856 type:complete len:214 (-) Transcript_109317:431-1072(-)
MWILTKVVGSSPDSPCAWTLAWTFLALTVNHCTGSCLLSMAGTEKASSAPWIDLCPVTMSVCIRLSHANLGPLMRNQHTFLPSSCKPVNSALTGGSACKMIEEIRSMFMYLAQSAFWSAAFSCAMLSATANDKDARLSETYSVTVLRGSGSSEYVAIGRIPRKLSLPASHWGRDSFVRHNFSASSLLVDAIWKSTCLPTLACCTRDIIPAVSG